MILGDAQGNIEEYTLGELLPESFFAVKGDRDNENV